MGHLIEPHGGKLVDLFCSPEEKQYHTEQAIHYVSVDLTPRQLFDLELLLNGGFSPLEGFMTQKEYDSVVASGLLPTDLVWPIPVCLDVSAEFARQLAVGQCVALRDLEGFMLAVMTISDIWKPDKHEEARQIYGTDINAHPGVALLLEDVKSHYIGGKVRGIQAPLHYDYKRLRLSPAEVRENFRKLGWRRVLAFETHKPLHNAHRESTIRAARENNANIFLHPIVGTTHPGDIDHYARVRCYEAIARTYPADSVILGLLPLAMRMAGPKEALWHAIIRKNFGCTHFMVAPDHADPFAFTNGKRFYPIGSAQQYVADQNPATGVQMAPLPKMAYLPARAQYILVEESSPDERYLEPLSATELRRRLTYDLEIPAWFSHPSVVEVLRKAYPARAKQGFTVFMTGLSGSGKSTIARVLMTRFMEKGDRPATLLDGDIVRKNLSSELKFSRRDRNLNITRIGFVASEITKNGGIALCAPIAPYRESREQNRNIISRYGGYIEVFVSTPLSVCEHRDRKGLYAKARAGIVKGLTGIDDPYEIPDHPEVTIDTTAITPEEAAEEVLLYLRKEGYLR